MKLLHVAAFLLLTCASANADSFTFSVLPAGGAVSATAGETVGWGYSITNQDPLLWLELTNFSAGVFTNGTPQLLFDFPILAPNQTITQIWIPGSAGLFEFSWDINAALGSTNAGVFIVTGQFWTGNPLSPGSSPVGAPIDLAQDYSVSVGGSQAVPEPGTLSLAILSLAVGRLLKRRIRIFHSAKSG